MNKPNPLPRGYSDFPTTFPFSTDLTRLDSSRHHHHHPPSAHPNPTFRNQNQNQPTPTTVQQQRFHDVPAIPIPGNHHNNTSQQKPPPPPPANTQVRAPPIHLPSVFDSSGSFVNHQQNHQPQSMTPTTPSNLTTALREQAMLRAQAVLSASSPVWEKFWASIVTSVAGEIYALSETYNQEIIKSREHIERTAKEAKAEKDRANEEIATLTEKCNRLEMEHNTTRLHALEESRRLSSACRALSIRNIELQKEVCMLKRTSEPARPPDEPSDGTVVSTASESNIPSEVLDKLRQTVASGYEKSLVHSTLEVIKYKKKCVELKRQLGAVLDRPVTEENSPSRAPSIVSAGASTNPEQIQSLLRNDLDPLIDLLSTPMLQSPPKLQSVESEPRVKQEKSTDTSSFFEMQGVIDLTLAEDNEPLPSKIPQEDAPEPSKTPTTNPPPSSSSSSSPTLLRMTTNPDPTAHTPVMPPTTPLKSPPARDVFAPPPPAIPSASSSGNISPLLATQTRTRDREDDEPSSVDESPLRTKRQRIMSQGHMKEENLSPTTTLTTPPAQNIASSTTTEPSTSDTTASETNRSNIDSSTNSSNPIFIKEEESPYDAPLLPLSPTSPLRLQKMSIKHIKLAYSVERQRLVCRLCLSRRKRVDPTTPVTSLPIAATWKDLNGHLQDRHPEGYTSLIGMSEADIAIMTRTIAAEEARVS